MPTRRHWALLNPSALERSAHSVFAWFSAWSIAWLDCASPRFLTPMLAIAATAFSRVGAPQESL